MKTCSKCGLIKPLDGFYKTGAQCKACRIEHVRNYQKERGIVPRSDWCKRNPELTAAASRRYRAAHPDRMKIQWALGNAKRRQAIAGSLTALDRAKTSAYRVKILNNPCHYCGEVKEEMHTDHYYPLARGGTDHWFNLVRACKDCNLSKQSRLASEFGGTA